MTKTTPKNDDGLRAKMATLLKTPLPVLRKRYAALGKNPTGLGRDELVKALATTADAQPASQPTKAPRTPRPSTRKRDERLPAVGTRITRRYKGREYVLEVLARGFRTGGREFSSSTAAALSILPYKAVSGPAWWGYDEPAKVDAPAPVEPPAPAKKKPGRPISKKRGG